MEEAIDGTRGDSQPDWIFPLIYDELRSIARTHLRRSSRQPVLQTTALVHEVYLRLKEDTRIAAVDRSHYLAIAARTLRRVLVDHVRASNMAKRGAPPEELRLDAELLDSGAPSVDLVSLDEALQRLAERNERRARVVELRFFGGLSVEETATVLGVSPRTVKDDWALARAFLHRELGAGSDG